MDSFMFPLICQGALCLFLSHELAQAPSTGAALSFQVFIYLFHGSWEHVAQGWDEDEGFCLRPICKVMAFPSGCSAGPCTVAGELFVWPKHGLGGSWVWGE